MTTKWGGGENQTISCAVTRNTDDKGRGTQTMETGRTTDELTKIKEITGLKYTGGEPMGHRWEQSEKSHRREN